LLAPLPSAAKQPPAAKRGASASAAAKLDALHGMGCSSGSELSVPLLQLTLSEPCTRLQPGRA
jgi:hypothetical protein